MVRYALSNRQMKELTIRGARLRIAIPCDAARQDIDDSPFEFARDALVHVDRNYIRGAEIMELLVAIKPSSNPKGLHTVLGEFIFDKRADQEGYPEIVQSVIVVVAELWAVTNFRQEMPIQWPAKVIRPDGTIWPPGETNQAG